MGIGDLKLCDAETNREMRWRWLKMQELQPRREVLGKALGLGDGPPTEWAFSKPRLGVSSLLQLVSDFA